MLTYYLQLNLAESEVFTKSAFCTANLSRNEDFTRRLILLTRIGSRKTVFAPHRRPKFCRQVSSSLQTAHVSYRHGVLKQGGIHVAPMR